MSFAFVFPGQGSQSVAMMQPYAGLPEVPATFAEAGEALGMDMWKLVEDGPASELEQTVHTQPVMLTAGIALFRAWKALGGKDPAVVAGHSLGEYSAMVAAGILDFSETVKFVRVRAQYMQEAVPHGTGAMAAVLGLNDDVVQAICKEAATAGVAEAANLNSPGQVVIAGTTAGVQRAIELAKERGAKRTVLLAMSAPSHCSLMAPAAERLKDLLNTITIRPPSIPVINNVDVAQESEPLRIRDAMIRQLCNPVRWAEIVGSMAAQGVGQIIECGPGAVLTGLNRRAAPQAKASAMKDADSMRQLIRDTNGETQ